MSIRRNESYRRRGPGARPRGPRKSKKFEENAIVLEVIPPDLNRRRDRYKDTAIVQAMGTSWFTLLEFIPEDYNTIMLHDSIALSKEERNQVQTIIGRIGYDGLTRVAELQVETIIDLILDKQEMRFVSWLNKASPISLRLHSLHLLKGVGPKSLAMILEERKLVPFTSFEEFEERTKVKDIRELIKQRILEEVLNETEKHRLFTRPHPKERK